MGHLSLGGMKMNSRNALLMLLVVSLATLVLADGFDTQSVRDKLDQYIASIGDHKCSESEIYEWGIVTNSQYMMFSNSVTNQLMNVLTNISSVATNSAEKLLVLGVGEMYDSDYYIEFYSRIAELAIQGLYSRREVKWLSIPHGAQHWNSVRIRYRENAVSNLMHKIRLAVPEWQNRCDEILSGVSYSNYVNEVNSGLWR